MGSYKSIRTLSIAALCSFAATVAAARGGVVPDTFKQSANLEKRTAKTSEDLDKYVAKLDKTEHALFLVSQAKDGDLRKRYESFCQKEKKLEVAQKRATADIDGMKLAAAEYFTSWDTSINRMSDPELRQTGAERRSKAMHDHDGLSATLGAIGRQLKPLMSDLNDLKAFLDADLSPANVGKASEIIQKSQSDARVLKDNIADVQTTLKRFLNEAPK